MDEDSILYQAMKNEMYPQVDPASMRVIDPSSQYQLGVEVRTRSPLQGGGGVLMNPTRMARPPNDFAGRPEHANQNPTYLRERGTFERNPQRPSENVINQYQQKWQADRLSNELDRYNKMYNTQATPAEMKAVQEYSAGQPSFARRALEYMREFFNKNRKPDWLD